MDKLWIESKMEELTLTVRMKNAWLSAKRINQKMTYTVGMSKSKRWINFKILNLKNVTLNFEST